MWQRQERLPPVCNPKYMLLPMVARVERETAENVGLAASAKLPEVVRDRTNVVQQ